jgi:hypothetical protein
MPLRPAWESPDGATRGFSQRGPADLHNEDPRISTTGTAGLYNGENMPVVDSLSRQRSR